MFEQIFDNVSLARAPDDQAAAVLPFLKHRVGNQTFGNRTYQTYQKLVPIEHNRMFEKQQIRYVLAAAIVKGDHESLFAVSVDEEFVVRGKGELR